MQLEAKRAEYPHIELKTFLPFPLTSAIDKSQQHQNNFFGTPTSEPRAAEWEARMLPLCFAAPAQQLLFIRLAPGEEEWKFLGRKL